MKSIFRIVVVKFVYILSIFFSYEISQWVRGKKNSIYSIWIGSSMGNVGRNSCFSYPLILQGGGNKNIIVGSDVFIGSHCILGCWKKYKEWSYDPKIIIGDNCRIGDYSHITAVNKITIGSGLLTGRFVYIGDNSHGRISCDELEIPPFERKLFSKGEITIGKNVWIGDKVTILGGVKIGDNAIIGANTVITHDIPSNSVVVGGQCRVINNLGGE